LLLSAELAALVGGELAALAAECVGDVDEDPVPDEKETPRSRETSLMSRQSIFGPGSLLNVDR